MSYNNKKFLDANGVTQIVGLLDDYATNETLSTVVNSVQTALDQKVSDVQINGTSILSNGVANIPRASQNALGVVRMNALGIQVNQDGVIMTKKATSANIKGGSENYNPIVPSTQHESAFYALAKLAGADMASSSNAVGTYTDAAKQGIQKLFGFENIFGTYQDNLIAVKDYAVGDTFIMDGKRYRVTQAMSTNAAITVGTNCELDLLGGRYVKDTDYATTSKAGVAKFNGNDYGIGITQTGTVYGVPPTEAQIKAGTNSYKPITANRQHLSVFYGLTKAAGVDMASSSNAVGTYTEAAKTAIRGMLGIDGSAAIVEEVTGTAPTITGMPNVRYVCGEVSLLTITPPACGSIEVIFTSGSTASTLTVPNSVKWPAWFDAEELDSNMIYDIIITDAAYGAVMSWAN